MGDEIEVLQPGLFSTIQDRGRFGFLKFGVPLSGSMDSYAATMANLFLRNQPDTAVMEITQSGPKLLFHCAAKIVICGGDFSPKINNQDFSNNIPREINPGEILSFGGRRSGCRAYVGIAQGFGTGTVMGSRSWYEGITEHHKLEKGMQLKIHPSGELSGSTNAALKFKSGYITNSEIPVFPGPEFHYLKEQQKDILFSSQFSVSKNNNRMGIQLEEVLENNLPPILTGPVLPGTVQLTPSGKMIVLMRDCQTTGGYPRILQLKEEGINTLAQKTMGDKVQFVQQEL